MEVRDFIALVFLIFIVGIVCVIGGIGCAGCAVFNKAEKEFGMDASLKKYEEFKKISATLEAKLASIKVKEASIKNLEKQYEGTPRKDWPRTDLEQHSLWISEMSGMRASYNSLAADYNSRMAMFNYSFANVGDLPKGATIPLPRDYKPYEEK